MWHLPFCATCSVLFHSIGLYCVLFSYILFCSILLFYVLFFSIFIYSIRSVMFDVSQFAFLCTLVILSAYVPSNQQLWRMQCTHEYLDHYRQNIYCDTSNSRHFGNTAKGEEDLTCRKSGQGSCNGCGYSGEHIPLTMLVIQDKHTVDG